MDNTELLNETKLNNPEIIADFSKNKCGELIINVNYNKTLSEERKNLEKDTKPLSKNIMILYFEIKIIKAPEIFVSCYFCLSYINYNYGICI